MIAQWMIYGWLVAGLLGLAALLAERVLVRWEGGSRWAWAASLALLFLLPALSQIPIGWRGSSGDIRLQIGTITQLAGTPGEGAGGGLDGVAGTLGSLLLLLWVTASIAVGLFFVRSHLALSRLRSEWRQASIEGHSVWLTRASGPAVVGFLRPQIVIPSWVEELNEKDRRLLVEHEAEHIRAGDMWLLLGGLAAVVAVPWNPAVWWQVSRLRSAMEIDCDRRVLRRSASVDSYGNLLLKVAQRPPMLPASAAAFTTRISQLERRLLAMTRSDRGNRWMTGAACSAAASLLLLASCGIDQPTGLTPSTDSPNPSIATVAQLSGEPTFTPYTIQPALLNRAEFGRALQEGYPPMLREAGIGGTPVLWLLIDTEGRVVEVQLAQSSGHEELDRTGVSLMPIARFQPAMHGQVPVPVWIQIPVTFAVPTPA